MRRFLFSRNSDIISNPAAPSSRNGSAVFWHDRGALVAHNTFSEDDLDRLERRVTVNQVNTLPTDAELISSFQEKLITAGEDPVPAVLSLEQSKPGSRFQLPLLAIPDPDIADDT